MSGTPEFDVLIAGGGPTGLAAGIFASSAGLRPLIVEPRVGVIDKACGEGLMPAGVSLLGRMGVDVTGFPFGGIRYVDGGVVAEGRFASGSGLGVRRTSLHAALLARADELGVARAIGRVEELVQGAAGVRVMVRTPAGLRTVRSRWVLAADGLHSFVRRALGLEGRSSETPRYGVRRHFASAPWAQVVEVHWGPGVEAYVTPVSSTEVGVALLFSGRARPEDLLWRIPAVAERLGEPTSDWQGAGPFGHRARRRVAGRVLLLGDAAGFLDPLTGEGVRLGMETAAAAVRCLSAGRPETYEAAWRRATWRYWTLTSGLLWAGSHPWTRERLTRVLRRMPWLFDAGLRFLER